jgi:lipopolysaccharide/colanic/teichoic acid biosynthesis glycosyltransferase
LSFADSIAMKSVAENLRVLFERLVGLLVVIVFLPTLLLLALFLRTNSDEPVLLTDRFVGKSGRPVQSYRFRTTGRGTSAFRVVGRFLRMYSLDELPGFWAVVRGECGLLDILRLEVRK